MIYYYAQYLNKMKMVPLVKFIIGVKINIFYVLVIFALDIISMLYLLRINLRVLAYEK